MVDKTIGANKSRYHPNYGKIRISLSLNAAYGRAYCIFQPYCSEVIFAKGYSPTARTKRRFSARFYPRYCLHHSLYLVIII